MGVCGGGWCIGAISGLYGISLWKNISWGWPSFSCYILYEIGDRLRVKFWKSGGVGHLLLLVISNYLESAERTRQVWLSL